MAPKGQTADDIVIGVKLQIEDVKAQFKAMKVAIQREMMNVRDAMAVVKDAPSRGFKAKYGATKGALNKKYREDLSNLKLTLKEIGIQEKEALVPLENDLKSAKREAGRAGKAMGGFNSQLLSAGLGTMFFGMAIKNLTQSIMKSSFTVFNEVAHSVSGVTTAFDILGNEMAYIGFLIGESLEPFAQALIPLVISFSELVERAEWLAPALLALFAAGTFLFVGGQLALGINAIKDAILLLAPGLAKAGGVMSLFSSASLAALGWIAAAVVAFIIMWKTNFGGIQQFMGELWDTLKGTFGGVFEGLKEIFQGAFMMIEGLFTGDFPKLFKGMLTSTLGTFRVIGSIIVGLSVAIINALIFIVNGAMDLMFNSIKLTISALDMAADWIDDVFGTDFGAATDAALGMINATREAVRIGYVDASEVQGNFQNALDFVEQKIEVMVQLDGEQVAESVTTRVVDGVNQAS